MGAAGGWFWLCYAGVGLSLNSRWSISAAPVRGGSWFWLCSSGVGLSLLSRWSISTAPVRGDSWFWLCSLGVGLSLNSRWSISTAPVRGDSWFWLCSLGVSLSLNSRWSISTAPVRGDSWFWLCSSGVGLSLLSRWSISTAPVRGDSWFWLCSSGLAFPCFHGGLLVLPLCGAALTFFAAAKKVSKESGLTPPALKWVPWLGGGSGTSGIGAPAHSAFVTRQSYFPPRTSCSPERTFFRVCANRCGRNTRQLVEHPLVF